MLWRWVFLEKSTVHGSIDLMEVLLYRLVYCYFINCTRQFQRIQSHIIIEQSLIYIRSITVKLVFYNCNIVLNQIGAPVYVCWVYSRWRQTIYNLKRVEGLGAILGEHQNLYTNTCSANCTVFRFVVNFINKIKIKMTIYVILWEKRCDFYWHLYVK